MKILSIFLLTLFVLFLPLNFMDAFTWGNTPKDAEDPTTIEEYIATAIQDHLDDPDAHALEGQSIAIHRENQVVDHPAGSILSDKTTMYEVFMSEHWTSIDTWSSVGDVQVGSLGNIEMLIYGPSNFTSRLYSYPNVPYPFQSYDFDRLFQTTFWTDDVTLTQQARLGFYIPGSPTGNGFGFKIIDGVVNAHSKTTPDGEQLTALSIDYGQSHIYRVHHRVAEGIINFYVDGNLLATHTITRTGSAPTEGILFEFEGGSGDEYTAFVGQSVFSRSLI